MNSSNGINNTPMTNVKWLVYSANRLGPSITRLCVVMHTPLTIADKHQVSPTGPHNPLSLLLFCSGFYPCLVSLCITTRGVGTR